MTANLEHQPPVLPASTVGTVLALGIEVHRLTASLLEPVRGRYRLAAWWIAPSRLHRSVAEQVQDMCERFGARIERRLWDHNRYAPYIVATDAVKFPPLAQVVITASPRPHLRVWIAGLTPNNSLAAARNTLEAGHVQIMGTTCLRSDTDPHAWAHELKATLPETLVLAGGYDSTESQSHGSLISLTHSVSSALSGLPDDSVPEIVFAGNAHAYQEVAGILQSRRRLTVIQVDNVLPAPGRVQSQPLVQAIDELYWQKCRRMRDFAKLEEWSTDSAPIISIESSFARLVQLWLDLNDLTELHGVYAGSDRWFHVWADARTDRILARFTAPGVVLPDGAWWPPLRLMSGPLYEDSDLPDSVVWWDRSGLAPATASTAHTAPQAAVEALRADLLVPRRGA